jgi:hypothetical protein
MHYSIFFTNTFILDLQKNKIKYFTFLLLLYLQKKYIHIFIYLFYKLYYYLLTLTILLTILIIHNLYNYIKKLKYLYL